MSILQERMDKIEHRGFWLRDHPDPEEWRVVEHDVMPARPGKGYEYIITDFDVAAFRSVELSEGELLQWIPTGEWETMSVERLAEWLLA
jgi:hypothetical protein